jgi:phosphogluconate dehydratase
VQTIAGQGLDRYTREPKLREGALHWDAGPKQTLNDKIVRPVGDPFQPTGGLKRLRGSLGVAVSKVSAVKPEHHVIEAPVRVFHDQDSVKAAYQAGEFTGDVIVVVRFQGPRANGMPELHSLTPVLANLQAKGLKVALVTDGRMSGASGKVLSAIHVCPEAVAGGPIAKLQDGDILRVDAQAGVVEIVTPGVLDRAPVAADLSGNAHGQGRALFANFRALVQSADTGASCV